MATNIEELLASQIQGNHYHNDLGIFMDKHYDSYWGMTSDAQDEVLQELISLGDSFEKECLPIEEDIDRHVDNVNKTLRVCNGSNVFRPQFSIYLMELNKVVERYYDKSGMKSYDYKIDENAHHIYALLRISCLYVYLSGSRINVKTLEEKHFGEKYRGLLRLAFDSFHACEISFERVVETLAIIEDYVNGKIGLNYMYMASAELYKNMFFPIVDTVTMFLAYRVDSAARILKVSEKTLWGLEEAARELISNKAEFYGFRSIQNIEDITSDYDDTFAKLYTTALLDIRKALTEDYDKFLCLLDNCKFLYLLLTYIEEDFEKCPEMLSIVYRRFILYLVLYSVNNTTGEYIDRYSL